LCKIAGAVFVLEVKTDGGEIKDVNGKPVVTGRP
jgi:hypothetical protein